MRIDYTTAPAPVHVLHSDRYVRLYWPVSPDSVPDSYGCTPHYTLTFEHTNTRSGMMYRATESLTAAAFPGDGTHRESATWQVRQPREVIAELPAARYSAPRFAAFVKGILG